MKISTLLLFLILFTNVAQAETHELYLTKTLKVCSPSCFETAVPDIYVKLTLDENGKAEHKLHPVVLVDDKANVSLIIESFVSLEKNESTCEYTIGMVWLYDNIRKNDFSKILCTDFDLIQSNNLVSRKSFNNSESVEKSIRIHKK